MNEAASRKILIRADAGGSLGTGHVMRMLALSQALRKRGIKVILASIQCPEPIVRRLQSAEVEYHPMDKGVPGGDEDNSQTLQLAKEAAASWVVLDGYHFTHAYQQSIHSAGFKLAVMDDFDHTDRWCADLVINQNLGAETKDYDNDVDGHRVLAGHCFALLREEFASISTGGLSNAGPLQKILVTMGGVDSGNATGEVLQLLDRINVPKLDLKVVAGGGNPHMEALEKLARSSRHSIMLVQDVEDMGSLYKWADGVVSAGGSTCYEWLSHRLPAAIVQLADNQGPIVEGLASRGAALSLGPLDGTRREDPHNNRNRGKVMDKSLHSPGHRSRSFPRPRGESCP
jgi:UDP-2,4-diacetamido-2,4,6-trideoxy-beta-L-altropyranose hydrolase